MERLSLARELYCALGAALVNHNQRKGMGLSLLREIQEAASNSTTPIADVLKRCLVLASRLDHEPLKSWVHRELNGYSADHELPEYRKVPVTQITYNVQLGYQYATGLSVPRGAIPEADRDDMFGARLYAAVASLEDLASGEGDVAAPVDAGYAQAIVQRMYDDPWASCFGMSRILGRSQIHGVLDTIRTRVLEFVLEIERLSPEAGEGSGDTPALEADRVQSVFNMTIAEGGTANVAVGSTGVTQVSISVNKGDLNALTQALEQLGLDEQMVADLKDALEADEPEREPGSLGERTRRWLGWLAEQTATGAVQLAGAQTVATVVRLITMYLSGDVGPPSGGEMIIT